MSPREGTIGSELTLSGSGFGEKQGEVLIGPEKCKVLAWSAAEITCKVVKPQTGGAYLVTVLLQGDKKPAEPQDAAPSAAYAGRIKARIKPNIVLTTEVSGNPVAEIEVRCAPDGTIVGRRIVKPSGSPVWDETVLRAIDRTEILPRDTDGRVPPLMLLVFPRRE